MNWDFWNYEELTADDFRALAGLDTQGLELERLKAEAVRIAEDNDDIEMNGRDRRELEALFALVNGAQGKRQAEFNAAEAGRSAPRVIFDEFAEALDQGERALGGLIGGAGDIAGMAGRNPKTALGIGGFLWMMKNGGLEGGLSELVNAGIIVAAAYVLCKIFAPEYAERIEAAVGPKVKEIFNKLNGGDQMAPKIGREEIEKRKREFIKMGKAVAGKLEGLSPEEADRVTRNLSSLERSALQSYMVTLTPEEAEALTRGVVGDVALSQARHGASPQLADRATSSPQDFDKILNSTMSAALEDWKRRNHIVTR